MLWASPDTTQIVPCKLQVTCCGKPISYILMEKLMSEVYFSSPTEIIETFQHNFKMNASRQNFV